MNNFKDVGLKKQTAYLKITVGKSCIWLKIRFGVVQRSSLAKPFWKQTLLIQYN